MALSISEETLRSAKLSHEEFLIEMAVHLYDIGRLTMGQARKAANLDQISFQKELAKRNVFVKYELEDLMTDLNTIEEMKEIRSKGL